MLDWRIVTGHVPVTNSGHWSSLTVVSEEMIDGELEGAWFLCTLASFEVNDVDGVFALVLLEPIQLATKNNPVILGEPVVGEVHLDLDCESL